MEEFLNQEEASSKRLAHGDIIDGVVVRVDPDEVLVDVGSKSEGVISSRELGTREAGTPDLHSGDHIKVFVLQPENEDGNVVLSLRRARAESVWVKAQEQQATGEMMDAEVREQNKGGLIVNILGLRGFLPTSQVSRSHSSNLQELVGQQIGDEIEGKVSGLTTYGAFVNLGAADGLIHISELSWDRVANVADVLQVGQDVRVKVIKLDPDTSRISLSLRQLGQDPWDHIEKRFPPGAIVEGEVTKIKKYGAFLQIGDGIEGLLHISELAWEHVEHTEDVVQVGQKLKVRVLQADRSRRRISLSLKQAEEPPPGGRADESEVSDYPGEIERVAEPQREPVYAEVSAAPQD